jgi:glutathione S-transferase
MILIGQYDSPFVRRVGIALKLYGLAFEHKPWSVFADADRIRAYNPLTRVPTLVLDDGVALGESHLILDYLDSRAPKGDPLFPQDEPMRHRALRVAGLAMGVADKAVSLFYELRLHEQTSPVWVSRCRAQIRDTLALLEKERNKGGGRYWFGGRHGHADIAIACMWRFLMEAHPGLADPEDFPALGGLAQRMEAMEAFRAIQQPFIPPA